jgi:hypothetical protein
MYADAVCVLKTLVRKSQFRSSQFRKSSVAPASAAPAAPAPAAAAPASAAVAPATPAAAAPAASSVAPVSASASSVPASAAPASPESEYSKVVKARFTAQLASTMAQSHVERSVPSAAAAAAATVRAQVFNRSSRPILMSMCGLLDEMTLFENFQKSKYSTEDGEKAADGHLLDSACALLLHTAKKVNIATLMFDAAIALISASNDPGVTYDMTAAIRALTTSVDSLQQSVRLGRQVHVSSGSSNSSSNSSSSSSSSSNI